MLNNLNSCSGIRNFLTKPNEFVSFFLFNTRNYSINGPGNHFLPYPFACVQLNAFYSSFLSRNSGFVSDSSTDFNGHLVEKYFSEDNNDVYDKFRQIGVQNTGDLSFFGSCNGEFERSKKCNLDRFDEVEESDEEVEEQEEASDSDDNFVVLDSFDKNNVNREEIKRVEVEEDEFRHPLVREICRLIELRSAWNPKLEGELRHLLRSLKPKQVCAVLHSQSDERVALNFFYWADRQWRYRHDPIVYYVMLEILGKTKLCRGAKRVLRLMARRGIDLWPEAFSYLMVSYSRAGKLRKALQVLPMMQKTGVAPNLLICNTAIHVLVVGNRLAKALRFLEQMKLAGIMPNCLTYNCLIKGYCDLHRFADAIKLIDEMPLKGCSPDKVSYYTVMGYLCKEKRIQEVRDLMEKMVNDSNLLHDQVTYNTLIHMLSKHGHGDEALEFLREAEKRGFRVDKVGYSSVVHAFCKEGKLEESNELVNQMFQKGCIPDVVTYTAVVNGFCRVGKLDQAKKMLQEMYKHGCKPNTVSYTALLNGLCHNGKSSEAREMINTSEEEWWTPNAITYSVVMHGLRREGKLSEACVVVREMVKKGFFPTPVEINLLIQSLCRRGKMDEAKRFMQECLTKGCAVNAVNFTTVIHGFCQKDDLEAALSLLDDMYLCKKDPDVVTYTTIIDALGKKGRIEEATELIIKMLNKGLVPTAVTYKIVIHRYCQLGRVEDLLKLLEKMLSRQKCRTVYNQLIEKLCSFGYLEEADKLLSKVLRTASKVDASTCHVLMENYLNKEIPLLAYKVACRMFNRNLTPDLNLCEKVSKRLIFEGKSEEADSLMQRFVERGIIPPRSEEHLQK
ncbi:Pentatricopeptide repeat-containing protein [Melia azedarach]|uniref:Pentatricopeptide repeat-containing protein n=1 Tax=Melia azedarach TaxID=155640 RepID=A0ACC1WVI2_MELAZ|nr:Pentatricopeptide repeat-containing protein [Melia azedarach]